MPRIRKENYNRHLFLTSGGLTESMKTSIFNIIGKCPEEVKILYIPTAGIETDGAREGIVICLHELSAMEFVPKIYLCITWS